MDRKRFKKIEKYIVIYIAFFLLFSLLLYVQISYERSAEQRRMLTLLEKHPEWEAEIIALWYKSEDSRLIGGTNHDEHFADTIKLIEDKYGHNLQCILPGKNIVVFWAAGLLAGGGSHAE